LGGPGPTLGRKMQGQENSLFFDAPFLAILAGNVPPSRALADQLLATFFVFLTRCAPEALRLPKIIGISWFSVEFSSFFGYLFRCCRVARRHYNRPDCLCFCCNRSRRLWGVRRWPAVGVFNNTEVLGISSNQYPKARDSSIKPKFDPTRQEG